MTSFECFLWGFGGSIAVEIVEVFKMFCTDSPMPQRYRRPGFYFVRFSLAVVAGGLAVAYKLETPIVAINIGAATPLIIQTFAQNPPRTDQEVNNV